MEIFVGKLILRYTLVFMKKWQWFISFYELKYCMTSYICAAEEIASINIEYSGEFCSTKDLC